MERLSFHMFHVGVVKIIPFRCCNRLDRDTSGITVVAKHLVSGNILSAATHDRKIHMDPDLMGAACLQSEGDKAVPICLMYDLVVGDGVLPVLWVCYALNDCPLFS